MVLDTVLKLLTDSLIECNNTQETPNARLFLSELSLSFVVALTLASLLAMVTLVLGIVHLLYIGQYVTDVYRRAFILYLAGTAPFVSLFSLASMYMPRVGFLAHLLSFFYFSIGLYVIICLLLHIVQGRQNVVKKMAQSSSPRISVQTPPFCCVFPCLPQLPVEARRIRFCELMVLQTPCVRLVATIVSLVLYFEQRDAYLVPLKILDFVSLPSLLIGIYGCHILVTTVSKLDELCPYRYIVVFRLLDIYFAFFGLQQPVFDVLARAGVFGCGDTMSALDTAFFWKNFATVCESFFVTLISTVLLKPSRSALFDKYPSCRSVGSATTVESST